MKEIPCIQTSGVVLRKLSELETNQKLDDVAMRFLAERCKQCLNKGMDDGVFYLPLDKRTTAYFKYSVPKTTINDRPTLFLHDIDIIVSNESISNYGGWLKDNRDAFIVSIIAGVLVAIGTYFFY